MKYNGDDWISIHRTICILFTRLATPKPKQKHSHTMSTDNRRQWTKTANKIARVVTTPNYYGECYEFIVFQQSGLMLVPLRTLESLEKCIQIWFRHWRHLFIRCSRGNSNILLMQRLKWAKTSLIWLYSFLFCFFLDLTWHEKLAVFKYFWITKCENIWRGNSCTYYN